MKIENKIRCSRIKVDCVENDPVDIRCGGPNYLGFDFNVLQQDERRMIKYIIITLNQLNVPFIGIGATGKIDVPESHVWNEEKIVREIRKDAAYLINEANRSSFRRKK